MIHIEQLLEISSSLDLMVAELMSWETKKMSEEENQITSERDFSVGRPLFQPILHARLQPAREDGLDGSQIH